MVHARSQVLVILAALAFCARAAAEDRLVFAVDVIRHGDRTPLQDFPAAPQKWAEGPGQLTPQGMRQEYELGSRLRSVYVDRYHLLPANYQPGTMYVRSSDVERTLMSAQSLLAGLYPHGTGPTDPETGKPSLPDAAQPIPIHTIANSEESLLFPDSNAFYRYDDLLVQFVTATPAWREKTEVLRPQFARWSQATGITIKDLYQFVLLSDTLLIDRIHHVSPPPGLSDEDVRTITEAGRWAFVTAFKAVQIGRVTGHELLNAIADDIDEASRQKNPLKYVLFSAHDSTIMSQMSALGAPLDAVPPYASHLNFALFQSEGGDYSVKVSFNDKPVVVPGCGGESCTLAQFLALPGR